MIGPDDAARAGFIRRHARLVAPPLLPELRFWLAEEATDLWEASEAFLEETGLPPPYWAFAWAGGQALGRYVLDRPETVRGLRVLDYGAGAGLAAIAALKAGARSALAVDLDPFAAVATALNGAENGCRPATLTGDGTALDPAGFDVVLAADVCYERATGAPSTDWLTAAADRGVTVLIGDPGRAYLRTERLERIADYDVPTPTALENAPITPTRVWRIAPGVTNSG
ncbi:MAG: 50S ribosomal protein L11 methyltransferase [Alphaproteobacteria bacterium]